MLLKHFDILRCCEVINRINHALDIWKSTALCFLYPLLRITISVEDDSLMLSQLICNQLLCGCLEIICLLQHVCKIAKCVSNDCI